MPKSRFYPFMRAIEKRWKHSNLFLLLELFIALDFKLSSFSLPIGLTLFTVSFDLLSLLILRPLLASLSGNAFQITDSWIPSFLSIRLARLSPSSLIATLLFSILLARVLRAFFLFLSSLALAKIQNRFHEELRKKLFKKFLDLGKPFYDQTGAGKMQSAILTLTTEISNVLQTTHFVFNAVLAMAMYAILLMTISLKLTLFLFIFLPLAGLPVSKTLRRLRLISKTKVEQTKAYGQRGIETISSLPHVWISATEDAELKQFQELTRNVMASQLQHETIDASLKSILDIITAAAFVTVLGAWVYLSKEGHIALNAHYLDFLAVLQRLVSTFNQLTYIRISLSGINGNLTELLGILERQPKVHSLSHPQLHFETLKREIVFKNLQFSYHSHLPVLKGVSFSMPQGTVTALVGPSGAGKSTVMNLLLRLYEPPPGCLFIDGVDILQYSKSSLREGISVVSQENWLFNRSIRENVTYGVKRNVSDEEIFDALKKASLDSFVKKLPFGLETLIGDRGILISGGERQRICIARAILKRSSILLFDEATSALDTHTEKEVKDAINQVMANRTALVIAHRVSTIADADQILSLKNGAISRAEAEANTPIEKRAA